MSSTTAIIDLEQIRCNIRAVREKVGGDVRIMPVVKANAYGHGAVQVARAAVQAGADMLGVARLEEGVELRESGIEVPILILGLSDAESAEDIVANDITATACDLDFAQSLSRECASQGRPATVHVKVDTGMSRIGRRPGEIPELISQLHELPGIRVEGIFTHFPCADENDEGFTVSQISRFRELLTELDKHGLRPEVVHAANSGAVLEHPDSYFDMVRPGLLTYGYYPSAGVSRSVQVRPALTFRTKVVLCKSIEPGDTVSYGRTYRAGSKTKVATIPVGYADGFSRHLSNTGRAIVRGELAPVIGRVCMDQTMLDVTHIANVSTGDEVILYGRQKDQMITVEEVADAVNTVPHDVLCAISQRVPRDYLQEI